MIVDGYLQGIAFGLMTSFQNLTQCAIPTIVSYILMENQQAFQHLSHEDSHSSTSEPSKIPSLSRMIGISECEFMFALLAMGGVVAGLTLWYLDEYPPNDAPRGVLRAATKFSFEEVEKRARYNPTNVRPVVYSVSSGSSSTSTSTSSSYQNEGIHLLRQSLGRDAETPATATAAAASVTSIPPPPQHSQRGIETETEKIAKEDKEEEEESSYKLDRSDWIPYDSSHPPPPRSHPQTYPATEMTPLLSSSSSQSRANVSASSGTCSNTIPEDEVYSPMDCDSVPSMPPRRPSILRHFSVYSPSQAGPHGQGHIQKAISFSGEGPFPERKPGTGQHPQIPVMVRRNSFSLARQRFSHF
jgi:hypothetical protein